MRQCLSSRTTTGLLVAIFALACGAGVTRAEASGVSLVVNGDVAQMSPGPLERAGRVFVPLRGIFQRLGASVVYQNGLINATKGDTTVSLRIGSTQATVNGQQQYLDVAAFIVGATTYVPLRFVAQALGAVVNYDDSSQVVTIRGSSTPPPASAGSRVRLRAQQPAPDSTTANRFVVISAQFTHRVNPDALKIWLDGANVTDRCGRSATQFSYKPPAPYGIGAHTVRVAGEDEDGARFDRSWSFTISGSTPGTMLLTITKPDANSPTGPTFLVVGNTVPNAAIQVTAGASPAGTGQFNGSTVAGQLGYFTLNVSLNPLMGQQTITVIVTATAPTTGRTVTKTLYLRLGQ